MKIVSILLNDELLLKSSTEESIWDANLFKWEWLRVYKILQFISK